MKVTGGAIWGGELKEREEHMATEGPCESKNKWTPFLQLRCGCLRERTIPKQRTSVEVRHHDLPHDISPRSFRQGLQVVGSWSTGPQVWRCQEASDVLLAA